MKRLTDIRTHVIAADAGMVLAILTVSLYVVSLLMEILQ